MHQWGVWKILRYCTDFPDCFCGLCVIILTSLFCHISLLCWPLWPGINVINVKYFYITDYWVDPWLSPGLSSWKGSMSGSSGSYTGELKGLHSNCISPWCECCQPIWAVSLCEKHSLSQDGHSVCSLMPHMCIHTHTHAIQGIWQEPNTLFIEFLPWDVQHLNKCVKSSYVGALKLSFSVPTQQQMMKSSPRTLVPFGI